jgi:hypothetical protein
VRRLDEPALPLVGVASVRDLLEALFPGLDLSLSERRTG